MSDRTELVAKITADPKGLDAGLANASRRARRGGQRLGRELAVNVKRGFGSVGDLIGLGGVAGVLAAGKKVLDFQTKLVRLRQSSRAGIGTMQQLEKQLFAVGRARGVDPDDLLAGAEKYTELTGNLQGYIDRVDQLGIIAGATGSSVEELAVITAHASKQMGVGAADAEKLFDVLVRQGQMGSVELRNLASELPSLIATHRRFAKTSVDGMAELGAMMQLGQRGFSTASEAATGYERLMNAITVKAAKLKRHKVNVFDAKGNKRSASDIVRELAAVKAFQGKGESKLVKLLGSSEAVTFLKAFAAVDQETGKTSGQMFDELVDQAKAMGTVKESFNIWNKSPAKKMMSAQARLAEFFNENMKNHIEKFADALDRVAAVLQKVVDNWELLLAAIATGKGLQLLGDVAGAGGGGRGGRGGGGGGGGGGFVDKLQAVGLSFGAGYAAGTWLDEKSGGKLSGTASKGFNVIDVVDSGFKERWRDELGIGSDRTAEAEVEGRTRANRNRRMVRQDVMARAFAATGSTPEMFNEEQLRHLQDPLSDKLREGGGLGSLTRMIGEGQLEPLINEMRRLRETIQREGGGSVTVNADGANSTTHRRRGG